MQRGVIDLAQDEDYALKLLPSTEAFFRRVIGGKVQGDRLDLLVLLGGQC